MCAHIKHFRFLGTANFSTPYLAACQQAGFWFPTFVQFELNHLDSEDFGRFHLFGISERSFRPFLAFQFHCKLRSPKGSLLLRISSKKRARKPERNHTKSCAKTAVFITTKRPLAVSSEELLRSPMCHHRSASSIANSVCPNRLEVDSRP